MHVIRCRSVFGGPDHPPLAPTPCTSGGRVHDKHPRQTRPHDHSRIASTVSRPAICGKDLAEPGSFTFDHRDSKRDFPRYGENINRRQPVPQRHSMRGRSRRLSPHPVAVLALNAKTWQVDGDRRQPRILTFKFSTDDFAGPPGKEVGARPVQQKETLTHPGGTVETAHRHASITGVTSFGLLDAWPYPDQPVMASSMSGRSFRGAAKPARSTTLHRDQGTGRAGPTGGG